MKKNQLLYREWLALSLILGLIGSLITISTFSKISISKRMGSEFYLIKEQKIEILFTGAVKKPGVYYFPPGYPLKVALKEVGLLKEADRKLIDFKKVLYSSEAIEIPRRNKI